MAQLAYYEKQSAPLEKLLSLWLPRLGMFVVSLASFQIPSGTTYLDFFYLEIVSMAKDNDGWTLPNVTLMLKL